MNNDTYNIFDNITEEDVKDSVTSHNNNTIDEYFDEYKEKYSESLFIDINTSTFMIHRVMVEKIICRLIQHLNTLFEFYNIEHSEFLLTTVSAFYDDDIIMSDCYNYKHIRYIKENAIAMPDITSLFVYVNYPVFEHKEMIVMFVRMLNAIWNKNNNKYGFLIFSDIVAIKQVISYKQYGNQMYKYDHMVLWDNYAFELNNVSITDDVSLLKWHFFVPLTDWFMHRKINDFMK